MVTSTSFRQQFPEFVDPLVYTPEVINLWLLVAAKVFNAELWDELLDLGTSLFVAHQLVIGRRNQLAVAAGGVPGTLTGPKSSESVDRVSVGYDIGAIKLDDMGYFGLSAYGLQLYQMRGYIGAGGMQLGTCADVAGFVGWP